MAPLSRIFRPPSGSAMLIDDLVSRVTVKPAPVSFSTTSALVRTSPASASDERALVIASASARFAGGRSRGAVYVCALAGSLGSERPSSAFWRFFHASMRFPSAAWKYGCKRLPVVNSRFGITKFSSSRPLSRCSTHRTEYCEGSSPGSSACSKLSMRALFWASGRSASSNDSTPLVYFLA